MAFKMKGHTLPGINQKGNKGMEDGRANSSPFQQSKGRKFTKTVEKLEPVSDSRPEPTYEGTDEYRKEEDIPKKEFKDRGINKKKKSPAKKKDGYSK